MGDVCGTISAAPKVQGALLVPTGKCFSADYDLADRFAGSGVVLTAVVGPLEHHRRFRADFPGHSALLVDVRDG
jgi:hypothetical protein